MLYADDQMILAKTEDEMQVAAHTLNKIARKYSMKISTTKTKSVAVCGKNIQRAKTVINYIIIEQVTDFTYLGNTISAFKTDITKRIHWYNKTNGIIKNYFGKNMLPNTKLRVYNITFKAALKCGSEVWISNKKEFQKLGTAQMKFLRSLLGLTSLNHQRNTIREKLKL
jgi:hypothetical protein